MQEKPAPPQCTLVVVCGVAGSGKSSVARCLADHIGYSYLDADDFHSDEARSLMARGIALDDEQRAPWINALCRHLREAAQREEHYVLAFSGLKKQHRDALRQTGYKVIFLLLEGSEDLIRERLEKRQNHFMAPELLQSQFSALEMPVDEPDVLILDTSGPLRGVVQQAFTLLTEHKHLPRD